MVLQLVLFSWFYIQLHIFSMWIKSGLMAGYLMSVMWSQPIGKPFGGISTDGFTNCN
jgi:hypothetical protein